MKDFLVGKKKRCLSCPGKAPGPQQPPGQAAVGERRLWVKEKLGWGGRQPEELGTDLF